MNLGHPFYHFMMAIHSAATLSSSFVTSAKELALFLNFENLVAHVAYIHAVPFIKFIRLNGVFNFPSLVDLFFYDKASTIQRLCLIYVFRSKVGSTLLSLRTATRSFRGVFSITSVYANAGWSEREAMEMIGVIFVGHDSFHCLLKEYECSYYPLRRDFALSGFKNALSSDTVSFGGLLASARSHIIESNKLIFC